MAKASAQLSREMWIEAALHAVAEGGLDAIAVEPLASRLGTTKGSFYWHFKDRADLVTATGAAWERAATDSVIEGLNPVADSADRLRQLLSMAFRDERRDNVDLAMLGAANHPLLAEVVARVTAARLAFLETIFADLGFTPAVARTRARIAYAAYVGHLQLRLLDPNGMPTPRTVKRYTDELAGVLLSPRS